MRVVKTGTLEMAGPGAEAAPAKPSKKRKDREADGGVTAASGPRAKPAGQKKISKEQRTAAQGVLKVRLLGPLEILHLCSFNVDDLVGTLSYSNKLSLRRSFEGHGMSVSNRAQTWVLSMYHDWIIQYIGAVWGGVGTSRRHP